MIKVKIGTPRQSPVAVEEKKKEKKRQKGTMSRTEGGAAEGSTYVRLPDLPAGSLRKATDDLYHQPFITGGSTPRPSSGRGRARYVKKKERFHIGDPLLLLLLLLQEGGRERLS